MESSQMVFRVKVYFLQVTEWFCVHVCETQRFMLDWGLQECASVILCLSALSTICQHIRDSVSGPEELKLQVKSPE